VILTVTKFENRLIFGEVIRRTKNGARFSAHPVCQLFIVIISPELIFAMQYE